MSIPVSQIVQVNPGVLAAAGSAVDLNGLILTSSTKPPVGLVPSFATAADVGGYFGLDSDEYTAAKTYFNGPDSATVTPGLLYFAQYPDAAVSAYLRGGSLSAVTLSQLKTYTGTLTVSSGGSAVTSSSIDLSSATSFSNAATLIESGFTSPPFAVSYDAQLGAFMFTNSDSGSSSAIGYATGTLAADLNLTSATGAVVSNGADAAVPGSFMDSVVAITQNWGAFSSIFEPVVDDKTAFSKWTNDQNDRYAYVGWDSDSAALTAGSTATWAYAVEQAQYDGSVPIYGGLTHAAFILGAIASLDFSRLNGRKTFAFQSQSGLAASVSDATNAATLIANGYNFYGAYANAKQNFLFFYPGSTPGRWKWLDSYVNQIWLNAQLQLAMITLLSSAGSVPYNAEGYAMIDAAVSDPVNAAVNFGAIRTGVTLSNAQIAEIKNAVGADASPAIRANGYYLYIQPATASQRADRASPAMTLYYADGGSIQKLNLASIEVQ